MIYAGGLYFTLLTGTDQTTLPAGETSKTISVAHLPPGLYIYVVSGGGAVLARGKVAVVR